MTPAAPRVLVIADDLVWATRLADQLRLAGAAPVSVRGAPAIAEALTAGSLAGVIVDLGTRAGDGLAHVSAAVAAGLPVLAVGQHEDVALRRRALAAGAWRVLSYRAMFERGPATLAAWLGIEALRTGAVAPVRTEAPRQAPVPAGGALDGRR